MFDSIKPFPPSLKAFHPGQAINENLHVNQVQTDISREISGTPAVNWLSLNCIGCLSIPKIIAWVITLSFLNLWLPIAAFSQVLYGSLTGSVSDQSGAVIAGAKVEVLNLGTNLTKSATTDWSETF